MFSSCGVCGFDPSSLHPADAIVALRSFPRRYRALVEPPADDDDDRGPDRQDRPPGDRRRAAALSEAGVAAGAIAALGDDLRRVLVSEDPVLSTGADEATAPRHEPDPTTALAHLDQAVAGAVAAAEGQPADAWTRRGTRADGPVAAIDLLREAVHAGVHHLREATDGDVAPG